MSSLPTYACLLASEQMFAPNKNSFSCNPKTDSDNKVTQVIDPAPEDFDYDFEDDGDDEFDREIIILDSDDGEHSLEMW